MFQKSTVTMVTIADSTLWWTSDTFCRWYGVFCLYALLLGAYTKFSSELCINLDLFWYCIVSWKWLLCWLTSLMVAILLCINCDMNWLITPLSSLIWQPLQSQIFLVKQHHFCCYFSLFSLDFHHLQQSSLFQSPGLLFNVIVSEKKQCSIRD